MDIANNVIKEVIQIPLALCNAVSIVRIPVISTTLHIMIERFGFWWESNSRIHKNSDADIPLSHRGLTLALTDSPTYGYPRFHFP